jgi:hypothetical protein
MLYDVKGVGPDQQDIVSRSLTLEQALALIVDLQRNRKFHVRLYVAGTNEEVNFDQLLQSDQRST